MGFDDRENSLGSHLYGDVVVGSAVVLVVASVVVVVGSAVVLVVASVVVVAGSVVVVVEVDVLEVDVMGGWVVVGPGMVGWVTGGGVAAVVGGPPGVGVAGEAEVVAVVRPGELGPAVSPEVTVVVVEESAGITAGAGIVVPAVGSTMVPSSTAGVAARAPDGSCPSPSRLAPTNTTATTRPVIRHTMTPDRR
jgi:hypothetical protein